MGKIRKDAHISQTEFAERLGLSRIFISKVEIDQSTLSDRTIRDICREFSVNEEWLRTGEGEMYVIVEDDVSAAVADLLEDTDSELNALIIKTLKEYRKLDDKSKQVVNSFIRSILEE